MESKVIRRSYSKAGFVALVVILMQLGISMFILPMLFPNVDPATGNPFLIVLFPLVLSYVISIPLSFLIVGKSEEPDKMPEKHQIPFGKLVAWFMVFFAVSRIVLLITNVILTALAGEEFVDPVTSLQMSSPWMMFILASVIAPVVEELIFRGLLYKVLAPYGGKWYMVISALLFGLFHLNVSQIPFAFILGLFFAYTMYRTGNLLVPVLLHFATNLFSSISMLFINSEIGLIIVSFTVVLLMLAGLVVGIVLLAKGSFKKDIVFEPATVVPAKVNQVLINVGILLSVPIMLALTFLLPLLNS